MILNNQLVLERHLSFLFIFLFIFFACMCLISNLTLCFPPSQNHQSLACYPRPPKLQAGMVTQPQMVQSTMFPSNLVYNQLPQMTMMAQPQFLQSPRKWHPSKIGTNVNSLWPWKVQTKVSFCGFLPGRKVGDTYLRWECVGSVLTKERERVRCFRLPLPRRTRNGEGCHVIK